MKTRKACPSCGSFALSVRRSRDTKLGRSRLMLCRSCGEKWRTVEVPEVALTERERVIFAVTEELVGALQVGLDKLRALRSEL